ncbi:MAG: ATP-binding protein [Gammaproteobacteria bacterium]|nr:ATP-binding protein [Gammaproteobacteria bacterium]
MTGRSWFEVAIPEARREVFAKTYREALSNGEITQNVNYIVKRNGERVLVRWADTFIRDDDGTITGILSSGEDITERRNAEKAMIASQRVLAAEEVVSAVAHDFNNALQGVVGNIDLALGAASLDDKTRSLLQTAAQLAGDAAERVKSLQRMSSPTSESDAEIVNLHGLAEEVLTQTRHLWKDEAERTGRSISARIRSGNPAATTKGNRNELRSVLYNIVKNAIEAIEDQGKVDIDLDIVAGYCRLSVSDTGVGMDTETSTRIFQPFFSTKGMESGRGLGMSASHGIIRAHGGELRVAHSEVGEGTSIELQLPHHEAAEETSRGPAPASSSECLSRTMGRRRRGSTEVGHRLPGSTRSCRRHRTRRRSGARIPR